MNIVLLPSEEILFILDGLDECKRKDSVLVNKLAEVHSRFDHVALTLIIFLVVGTRDVKFSEKCL